MSSQFVKFISLLSLRYPIHSVQRFSFTYIVCKADIDIQHIIQLVYIRHLYNVDSVTVSKVHIYNHRVVYITIALHVVQSRVLLLYLF